MIRVEWSEKNEEGLRCAAGDSAPLLASIREEVKSGAAQLWLFNERECSGLVVTRPEQINGTNKIELVIVLGEGRGAASFIPYIVSVGKKYKVHSIRAHNKRRGLTRLYEKNGFVKNEIDKDGYQVVRRVLNGW